MTTLAVEDQSAIFGHRLPSKYRSLLALAKTMGAIQVCGRSDGRKEIMDLWEAPLSEEALSTPYSSLIGVQVTKELHQKPEK